MEKKPKIFISHSSKDKVYVDILVEFLTAMRIKNEDIYCTSTDGYGIKSGENIYESIREQFVNNNLLVIYMLSKSYYKSEVCLNEMGASYIMQCPYEIFFLPGFNYSDMKGMIDNKQAIKFDSSVESLSENLEHLVTILYKYFNINDTVPDMRIYAKHIYSTVQNNLKSPSEVWLQNHSEYDIRGKWLHM